MARPSKINSGPRHHALAALIASGLSLLLPANQAQAAGYRFGTQSAAGEGTANANGAEGADASTIFANPAAITRLSGWQFSGVLDFVKPNVRFTDQGSTIALPGSGFQPVPISKAGESQSPTNSVVVPHFYGSYKYSDSMAFGVGAFVPYGAKLDYEPSWGGRYNLNSVELKSFAINPNIAWKPSQSLSLAFGITAQYMEGDLKRATPYGSAYAAGLLAAAGQAAAGGAPGLALQLRQQAAKVFGDSAYDGSVHVSGNDWGFGTNLALLWEIDEQTRVGASWRSSISHKLKGTGDWTQPSNLPPEVLAAITGKPGDGHSKLDHNDSGASLNVKTHDSLSMNAFRQLDSRFAVMADATWYRYSTLETLRINFDSTAAPSITAEHWKDAWRVSLGGNWKVAPALLLRAGVSFDKSPVDTVYRSPALPDSDRTWYALGANFAINKQASVDLSFGYVKLKDAPMSATDDAEGVVPCSCAYSTVRGNYESSAKTVGVQLNYQF
ncbi:OmpP1/FadL family transporter [Roseateles oligotrophus]|uniref:OmpP1/FadL family transporter n=1 Tax=Roseateles oligotrophus TaxID=1769250 RepID=A0ABT2Y9D4_9BURK|nr:OmpP1/FadL family transporter [Roseateles oligotrophus]MCV2366912.1 OmpP1/FadL family transporter [Roseateles oligotrophus]